MNISGLIMKAVEYDKGDPKRINHFMKVYAYAKSIGEAEQLPAEDMEALEAAAVLHDIGIHNAERLRGSSAGKYQETEGPPVAAEILRELGADEELVRRVCDMVGRHHTYSGIDSAALQILIEADLLVNIYEDNMGAGEIQKIGDSIFKTASARKLLDLIYLSEEYVPQYI